MDYRALGIKEKDLVIWYWIGDHKKYEQLLKSLWADPDLLSTKGFYFLHFYHPLSILAVQESNKKTNINMPVHTFQEKR